MVPKPVRVDIHAALAAAGNHLVDPACGHRAFAADLEPQLRPVRLRVPGAYAQIPVKDAGGSRASSGMSAARAIFAHPSPSTLI
jgi:hypothetical protein